MRNMNEQEFINYIRGYALNHYEKGGWDYVAEAWEEVACPDGFDDSPEDQWLHHLHETDIVKSKWTDDEFIDDTLEALRSNPFQGDIK